MTINNENMKTWLSLFLVIILMVSCQKKEESIAGINVNELTNKWWTVTCMEVNQSSAYMTVVGGLDYGKFRFNNDGTWTRMTEEAQLAICNPVDSTHTYILNSGSGTGGWGVPFGEIIIPGDSSWNISGKMIVISNWGNWDVIEQSISEITFTSSRTDYLYRYILIAE